MDTIERNGATSVELNAAAFRARQGLSGSRSAAVPQTGDDRLPADAEQREAERYGDLTARGMVRFTGSVYDPRQPGYCLPAWHPEFQGRPAVTVRAKRLAQGRARHQDVAVKPPTFEEMMQAVHRLNGRRGGRIAQYRRDFDAFVRGADDQREFSP